jgi:hypothetical protein
MIPSLSHPADIDRTLYRPPHGPLLVAQQDRSERADARLTLPF